MCGLLGSALQIEWLEIPVLVLVKVPVDADTATDAQELSVEKLLLEEEFL